MTQPDQITRYIYRWRKDLEGRGVALLKRESRNGPVVMYADHEAALAAKDAQIAELEQIFETRWEADQRAIKRWQGGQQLTWPDHADLCVWLLEQNEALRASLGAKAEEREELAAHAKATHEKTSSETNRAESWVAWQINQSIAAELRALEGEW